VVQVIVGLFTLIPGDGSKSGIPSPPKETMILPYMILLSPHHQEKMILPSMILPFFCLPSFCPTS
jgi:hypothetical protein